MNYNLPRSANIAGTEYEIRTDFRVILEMFEVMHDPNLSDAEKVEGILTMFYVDQPPRRYAREALKECYRFIGRGQTSAKKTAQLVDWEQDFEYIISPVNRVLGYESRAVEYDPVTNKGGLHWWTFMAAYMEVGSECLFSQIVNIRDKRARGKQLTKEERQWANRNQDLIRIRQSYSEADDDILKYYTGGEAK